MIRNGFIPDRDCCSTAPSGDPYLLEFAEGVKRLANGQTLSLERADSTTPARMPRRGPRLSALWPDRSDYSTFICNPLHTATGRPKR